MTTVSVEHATARERAAVARRPPARRVPGARDRARRLRLLRRRGAGPRKTPWIFTDELEWTQISRSIASTGHAARRGDPIYFKSLYAYVIAPVLVDPLDDRRLRGGQVRERGHHAAGGDPDLPAGSHARDQARRGRSSPSARSRCRRWPTSTSIVTDVLAYPYYALCSWLVGAGAPRPARRRDVVIAVVVPARRLLRPAARSSRRSPLAFVDRRSRPLVHRRHAARRCAANWTRGDKLGAIVLADRRALCSSTASSSSTCTEWQVPTQYYKNRMVDLGLRAGLSFTIGLGVLPVIGGLVSLRLPERRGDPAYRAYAAWAAATIGVVSRSTPPSRPPTLSTNFATLWEERDLIYLSPLLLLGTAMVFQAKRLDWRFVGGAAGFVARDGRFQGAPARLSVLRGARVRRSRARPRELPALDDAHDRAARARSASSRSRSSCRACAGGAGVAPLAAVLLFGWMLAGEISMTVGSTTSPTSIRATCRRS